MSKQPKRWQGQAIKFNHQIITTILPSSDQLETMDPSDLIDISNSLRQTQSELNEFQDILASYWLDTKS